jgi:hypothetical protein
MRSGEARGFVFIARWRKGAKERKDWSSIRIGEEREGGVRPEEEERKVEGDADRRAPHVGDSERENGAAAGCETRPRELGRQAAGWARPMRERTREEEAGRANRPRRALG